MQSRQNAPDAYNFNYGELPFEASQYLKASRLAKISFTDNPQKLASQEQKIKVLKEKIQNFDRITDDIYRGSYPLKNSPDALKLLADLGIKTIIDLREDRQIVDNSDKPYAKQTKHERKTNARRLNKNYEKACNEVGITRVRIPFDLDTKIVPGLVKGKNNELEEKYCQFVLDMSQAKKPVYVHCSEGQGRTSFMMILYRIYEMGLEKEDAISETDPYLTPSGEHGDLNACRELLKALLDKEPDFDKICHKKIRAAFK